MANLVKLKRSAVASKVPLTTDLDLGELAVNTYDGKLYLKKNNGSDSIVQVGSNADTATTAAACTGNAATATALATARSITLSGDVTGTATYNGTATTTITTVVGNDSHTHGDSTINGLDASAITTGTLSRPTSSSSASCTGNAATATALATARSITLSGDVTGTATYNGTATTTITTVVGNDSHTHTDSTITGTEASTASTIAQRDASGDINARLFRSEYDTTNATCNYFMTQVDTVSDNYMRPSTKAQVATALSGSTMNIAGSSTSCTGNAATATALATARSITLSGDVTGTATYNGTATTTITTVVANDSHTHGDSTIDGLDATAITTGTLTRPTSSSSASCTGNAATATKWATGRTIALTGDVTGTSGTFDGSGNLSFATVVGNDSHTHSTYLPLTGGTLTGDLTLAGKVSATAFVGETVNVLGDLAGGTDAIDLDGGNIVTATVSTSAQTFTFSNPPASGTNGAFVLFLTNGGSQTVTWPTSVDWPGGTAPSLTASGVDVLVFTTNNAGTTWFGFVSGQEMS